MVRARTLRPAAAPIARLLRLRHLHHPTRTQQAAAQRPAPHPLVRQDLILLALPVAPLVPTVPLNLPAPARMDRLQQVQTILPHLLLLPAAALRHRSVHVLMRPKGWKAGGKEWNGFLSRETAGMISCEQYI